MSPVSRARSRFARLVVLVMTTLVVAAFAGVPAQARARVEATCLTGVPGATSVPSVITGGRHAVVFIHGWNGGPDTMTGIRGAVRGRLTDRVATFLFNYGDRKDNWAADQNVSGCLAVYIDAISTASARGGGDGKVFLVGHSMGGLAARYASALTVEGRPVGDVIAGVVTLDTPHLGSFWGGTAYERSLAEFGELLSPNQHPLPPPDTDAARCLESHDGGDTFPDGCGTAPPYLPPGVPIHQIAGSVSITRTFWNIPLYTYTLDGDAVVDTASQHGYVGSGPDSGGQVPTPVTSTLVSCQTTTSLLTSTVLQTLGAASGGRLLKAMTLLTVDPLPVAATAEGQASPALAPVVALANLSADCSHMQITANPTAVEATIQALEGWINSLPVMDPAWLYELRSAGRADGLTGTRRIFTIDGEPSVNSTGLWIGCRGIPAVAEFSLAGEYRAMSALFVLDEHTPPGLVVRVTVGLDGRTVEEWQFSRGQIRPVAVNTTGATVLTLSALAISGRCTVTSTPYGVAYDAALFPATA